MNNSQDSHPQKHILPTVSVDELAQMTKKGFDEVQSDIAEVRAEMKQGFTEVRSEMKEGFSGIRQSLALVLENMATKKDVASIGVHTSDLERTVYKDHGPRLRRVEHKMHII